jgi:hypothetical protein
MPTSAPASRSAPQAPALACLPTRLPLTRPCRQVAVLRTSGRHTVGRVTAAWPGWVRVEVEQGDAYKDVPEGEVYRLLGGLRLA